MAFYDLDQFLDGQEEIKFKYKGKEYFIDPDIPFPDLLRAFTLMQEFGANTEKANQLAEAGANPEDEDMTETLKMFSKMGDLMQTILGADNWASLEADGFGFKAMQNLLPWLLTQITNTMSGEETPETPEEEEERALAAAGDGAPKAASPPQPSPENSGQLGLTSVGTTTSEGQS